MTPNNIKALVALAVLTALAIIGKVDAAAVLTFIGGVFMPQPEKPAV